MEGTKKIKSMSFHQYSWNSEVKTTWISLIGWPQKTSNMYIICTYFVDGWNRKNCLKDDTVVFLLQTLQRISIILTTLTDILPLQLPYLKNRLWSSCSGFNDWSKHFIFQRNLMKTYHNEANTSGITKIASKKKFGLFRTN